MAVNELINIKQIKRKLDKEEEEEVARDTVRKHVRIL